MCLHMLFKCEFCENYDPHTSQEYGFSAVLLCMCICKNGFNEKDLTLQESGFSYCGLEGTN